MAAPGLAGLRAFYSLGEEILLTSLPAACAQVVARRADGVSVGAAADGHRGQATSRLPDLPRGTYRIEALDADGAVLGAELTTVARHPGELPVHGFATSFTDEAIPESLAWLSALRCTVVQVYDWMEKYSAPLGQAPGWRDPSRRPVSLAALRALSAGIRAQGGVAHAYAPVYAVDLDFAADHPELLMYRGDGEPERLFDNIKLADPGNATWQRHFARAYGQAADSIGFGGFHLDTYGFPRGARNADGRELDMRRSYRCFLDGIRAARPADLLSFNQVNGVPAAFGPPGEPSFRYCEIWPPNDRWRHFEGHVDRSAGLAGHLRGAGLRGSLACYPPAWGEDPQTCPDRAAALRTVVLTEAIATCLGVSPLIYGDRTAALRDAYYPKHARLRPDEAQTVLAWHRFALSCRDLFAEGEDTSWQEIEDDNGAVSVTWADGEVKAEPLGGSVMARVVHGDGWTAVGVLDLSGSPRGSWSERCAAGSCHSAVVRVLVPDPGQWTVAVMSLGQAAGRFVPVAARVVDHREGRAIEVQVPLEGGWSVLRLARRRPAC
jgi:dextranase